MQITHEGIADFSEYKPHDECGIVVVASPQGHAAEIAADAITELANRGKEMTGVVGFPVGMNSGAEQVKGFGTGKDVFPAGGIVLRDLFAGGEIAQAQARYSTQGAKNLEAAQPHAFLVEVEGQQVSFSHNHNGNLTNTRELAWSIGVADGEYYSDSHLMGMAFGVAIEERLLKNPDATIDLKSVVLDTLPLFEGAFTGSIATAHEAIVYTDHHAMKPAVIGVLPDYGTIVASEVTALDKVNATVIREMAAGEIVIVKSDGSWHAEQWAEPDPKGCLLEIFYFMKPEGAEGTKALFHGIEIEAARRRSGEVLAEKIDAQIDPDFVFGIPASGVLSGRGFADASGVRYSETAVTLRDRSGNRSFISPTQRERRAIVRDKLEVSGQEVSGRVALAIDDTIIRGTTMEAFASMFYEAGARELHVGIAMAMVKEICDLGVDLGDPLEMLANHHTSLEGMAHSLGIDSLTFLEVRDILEEVLAKLKKNAQNEFCTGCLDGNYPSKTPTLVHPYYDVL